MLVQTVAATVSHTMPRGVSHIRLHLSKDILKCHECHPYLADLKCKKTCWRPGLHTDPTRETYSTRLDPSWAHCPLPKYLTPLSLSHPHPTVNFVPKMTYYVSSGTLNPTHSRSPTLILSLSGLTLSLATYCPSFGTPPAKTLVIVLLVGGSLSNLEIEHTNIIHYHRVLTAGCLV